MNKKVLLAVTAAVATFLAERGAALTDLVAGRTLEEVYFDAVGGAAAAGASGEPDQTASAPRRRRRRRARGRS